MRFPADELSPITGYAVTYAASLKAGELCSYTACSYGDETPAPATAALSLAFLDGTRTIALCRGCAGDLRRLLGRVDRNAKAVRMLARDAGGLNDEA